MADQVIEKLRHVTEGQIDFEGQRLSELLATVLLAITGGIAFIISFIQQDIKLALYTGLAGTALTFLAIVPPWPFFKRNPIQWQPVAGAPNVNVQQVGSHRIVVDGKVVA